MWMTASNELLDRGYEAPPHWFVFHAMVSFSCESEDEQLNNPMIRGGGTR